MIKYKDLFKEFSKHFTAYDTEQKVRGIGIEMELPIVTQYGEVVDITVIQKMFKFLDKQGFRLEKDSFSNHIISASRTNKESKKEFDYYIDTVMTDAGSSILEVVLAPQDNLYTLQKYLLNIIRLLSQYFDLQNCMILGCGIQPITPPSSELLMPKERYFFYERFSANNIISKSKGADAHLLTITASNQCHINIGQKEAITAVNVLNALSGLQIILHANSAIWKGKVDPLYKANREIFWKSCYPDRLNQIGIPPRFQTMEEYINYLLEFRPMLVKRKRLLQILNKKNFKDFMFDKSLAIGQDLEEKKVVISPQIADIHYLNTFCYFNARLVPKFGTIESRMCCQQPFMTALAPTAVTLGILANLENAQKLMEHYPLAIWKQLRRASIKHTFNATINGKNITPLLKEFLEIAKQGLLKRNLGEEIFLKPLYERIEQQKSPADEAIDLFEKHGMSALLKHYAFKHTDFQAVEHSLDAR